MLPTKGLLPKPDRIKDNTGLGLMPRAHLANIRWPVFILASLLAFAPFVIPAEAQQDRRLRGVALVIGNGDYKHAEIEKLFNPANDAIAVEDLLQRLGFETDNTVDAGARTLKRDIERLIEDAKGADVVVLYYAGHAIEAGGENFLVPVDADISSLELANERLVPLSPIVARLQAVVPIVIVLLDACRNNPFPPNAVFRTEPNSQPLAMAATGLATRSAVSIADSPAAGDNIAVVVGFAAEPGKVALDGERGRNSPYAAAVLKHFAGANGANFSDVMTWVTEEVYLSTRRQQRPWVNASLRRPLNFGGPPEELSVERGEIVGERRQLLLTIAALPDFKRDRAEAVAEQSGVSLDVVYGMLRKLGSQVPEDAANLEEVLRAETERFAKILAEREVIESPDPEIVRLTALADQAEQEGLLSTADTFRERAKARFRELVEPTLEKQEAALRQRFVEGAAVFARSAETKMLAFDYLAAARDYSEAYARVAGRDAQLAWRYKVSEMLSQTYQGKKLGDNRALQQAIETGKQAAEFALTFSSRDEWAQTQNFLGSAYRELGRRQTVPTNLEAAVAAHLSVLEVWTKDVNPSDWAATQSSLGLAYALLGEMKEDRDIFEKAIAAFRAALTIHTQESNADAWAETEGNLASALGLMGDGFNDAAAMKEAIAIYREKIFTTGKKEDDPTAWAIGHSNVGHLLTQTAMQSLPEDKERLLKEAVSAHVEALDTLKTLRDPIQVATTQNNLGMALSQLGQLWNDAQTLRQAIAAFRSALQVRTPDVAVIHWAVTQRELGDALAALGRVEGDRRALEEAIESYRAALSGFAQESSPHDWLRVQERIAISLTDLASRTNSIALLREAIGVYRSTLEIRTIDKMPVDWAVTQGNICDLLERIGELEQGTSTLEEAVQVCQESISVSEKHNRRTERAAAQTYQALALIMLARRLQVEDHAVRALNLLAEAWNTFEQDGDTSRRDFVGQILQDTYGIDVNSRIRQQ